MIKLFAGKIVILHAAAAEFQLEHSTLPAELLLAAGIQSECHLIAVLVDTDDEDAGVRHPGRRNSRSWASLSWRCSGPRAISAVITSAAARASRMGFALFMVFPHSLPGRTLCRAFFTWVLPNLTRGMKNRVC